MESRQHPHNSAKQQGGVTDYQAKELADLANAIRNLPIGAVAKLENDELHVKRDIRRMRLRAMP